jgi:type IV pilus assembly protein PilV
VIRSSGHGSEGFTLLEVMIAMVIMGVGLLTIALAQLTAMRIGTESRQLTQAMYLAEQQMGLFYVAKPTAAGTFPDPGNPIEVAAIDDDLTTFNRTWTVQTDTPSVGLTTVSIQVTWNNPTGNAAQAGRRNVTLQGILGR